MLAYRSTFSVGGAFEQVEPAVRRVMVDWAERKHRKELGPDGLGALGPGGYLQPHPRLELLLVDSREQSEDQIFGFVVVERDGEDTWTSQVMAASGPRLASRSLISVEIDSPSPRMTRCAPGAPECPASCGACSAGWTATTTASTSPTTPRSSGRRTSPGSARSWARRTTTDSSSWPGRPRACRWSSGRTSSAVLRGTRPARRRPTCWMRRPPRPSTTPSPPSTPSSAGRCAPSSRAPGSMTSPMASATAS